MTDLPATIDAEAVQALVAEVLRRIRPASAPTEPAAAGQASPAVGPTGVAVAGRVIALAMLERLPPGTVQVLIEPAAVVTPSARDHARSKGIVIERMVTRAAATAAPTPFLVAQAECAASAAQWAAAVARAVPGATQLPACGLADVVATLALHASRDAARGVLLCGRPAVAVVLANRSASLRAVTGRDPVSLAAAAAECQANLLVVDPASFPPAALPRLAADLAARPAGEIPAPLAAKPAGCGCQGH